MNNSEQYKEHIEYTLQPFVKLFSVMLPCLPIGILPDGRNGKYPLIISWKKGITIRLQQTAILRNKTSSTELIVCGEKIVIENERLAKVFSGLPKLRQEVLALYFFFGYTDKKIGELYGKSHTTVNYWKIAALKQLRKEMERLEHEEQENDTF